MAMTIAEPDTAVLACRQALTALQQQIQAAAPGITARISPSIGRPQLRLVNDGRLWMLSPLGCDPLTRPGGRYVLPPSALADLRRIAATGVEFHDMVVAHELDLNGPAGQLIPQLRAGPRSCPPDLAWALVGPVPADPRAAQLARSMSRVMTALARPATTLAHQAGEAARRLDPVLFGLIGADGRLGPGWPVLWVACTKWEW
jgi:hypothetical protein